MLKNQIVLLIKQNIQHPTRYTHKYIFKKKKEKYKNLTHLQF